MSLRMELSLRTFLLLVTVSTGPGAVADGAESGGLFPESGDPEYAHLDSNLAGGGSSGTSHAQSVGTFDVRSYGARGDAATDNTVAMREAVAAAHSAYVRGGGGGVARVVEFTAVVPGYGTLVRPVPYPGEPTHKIH